MKPILEIKNVSKKFRIRHKVASYLSLRDKIVEGIKFKRTMTSEEFWALKDIQFDVEPGESVGIIGKNGAGKSTLLKILSKITPPTEGSIISRGRIASLLEVGTGFHPELSGRENIFLNGSILGMRKKEIRDKFDEIVDFSGVENFLDTPLKHYSSGMQLRLAFAVAAFLEPEILIIDEVLAVGDAEFQKKCIGKMGEVARSGRTILFVSHNMGTVLQLCKRCVMIKAGKIEQIGAPKTIIDLYHNSAKESFLGASNAVNNIYLKKIETFNSAGFPASTFAHSDNINLRLTIGINKFEPVQNIGLAMLTREKARVFTVNKSVSSFVTGNEKEIVVEMMIEGGLIAPMDYSFLVALNSRTGLITYEWHDDICPIKIYDDGTDYSFAEGMNYGCIILKDKWRIINSEN